MVRSTGGLTSNSLNVNVLLYVDDGQLVEKERGGQKEGTIYLGIESNLLSLPKLRTSDRETDHS